MVVTDRDGNVHDVEGRPGLKLMETLREYEYGVTAICGGLCSCATCHIFVAPAWMERLHRLQMAGMICAMVAVACIVAGGSR